MVDSDDDGIVSIIDDIAMSEAFIPSERGKDDSKVVSGLLIMCEVCEVVNNQSKYLSALIHNFKINCRYLIHNVRDMNAVKQEETEFIDIDV